MTFGLLFWVIMLIMLLAQFSVWWNVDPRLGYLNFFILWVLLALLGWHVFGPMVHS